MSDEEIIVFKITKEDCEQFKRLDAFLAEKLQDYSRSLIKKMFLEGRFESNNKIELKKMPSMETEIIFNAPELSETQLVAQNIPLEILFEDEFLMIINKPAGLVVHPAPGNPDGTLVNAILYHCDNLQGIGNEKRPGIVHRLDKGTSGIMVVAKEQKTHEALVQLFANHDISRKYEAITLGSKIPDKRSLESLIGRHQNNRLKMSTKVKQGKTAITHLNKIKQYQYFAHVELTLETGRTHQIRVHLSELLNNPILNDQTYGKTKEQDRFLSQDMKKILNNYEHPFLHAKRLGFIHPITKKELLFEIPPPKIFQDILKELDKEYE